MPFTRVSLKSLIPKPYDFEPITVGDHIRKKRLQLGLFQREVAQQIGVDPWTALNWEKNRTEPPVTSFPEIFKFLGYGPFPKPETIEDHLKAKRREMGWTIKMAAAEVGVDPSTWGNWEKGHTMLYRKHRAAVAEILSLNSEELNQKMAARWNRAHRPVES